MLITFCVLLGVFAAPLVDIATAVVNQLDNSAIYITAVLGK